MQHDWMQWILCSMAQCFPIECSGFHAAWFNAVDSMQLEKLKPIECFGFHAEWFKAVDSMQHRKWFPNECSGFHTAWFNASQLNAVDFMKHDWMQLIPCSVKKWNLIEFSGFLQREWIQWIPCSMIECSGFYAAWPKACRLNAVDSMHCDWLQCTPCSVVKCIPIECSGFHAVWLNAVDSI